MRKIGVFLLVLIVLITPFSLALDYGVLKINNIIIPSKEIAEEAISTIYIYANSQRIAKQEDGNLFYFHNDHLGSPAVVTDAVGKVIEMIDYMPFGDEITEADSKIKYNSKELDKDTALLYYGARYYDSSIGRFITADTVKGNLLDSQSLNLYVYTKNNPMKYVDPNGNQQIKMDFRESEMYYDKMMDWMQEKSPIVAGIFGSFFGRTGRESLENTLSSPPGVGNIATLKTIEKNFMSKLKGFDRLIKKYYELKAVGKISIVKEMHPMMPIGELLEYGNHDALTRSIKLQDFGRGKVDIGALFHEIYHELSWKQYIRHHGYPALSESEIWDKVAGYNSYRIYKFGVEYPAHRVEAIILRKLNLPLRESNLAALKGQTEFWRFYFKPTLH